ncbi:hypothetical protein [Muricoccus vinaceus]|uniref:Uncharacterized protein n=1 Tax=Muricoccus vinaceus TaxID=424704 RepID=A0ABV6IRP4_9PROT
MHEIIGCCRIAGQKAGESPEVGDQARQGRAEVLACGIVWFQHDPG